MKSGVTTASYRALIAWAGQFDMLEAAAAGLSHLAWKRPAERRRHGIAIGLLSQIGVA